TTTDDFAKNQPIWSKVTAPTTPEVVLFRHPFTVTATLTRPELLIFADTRYEAWVDGNWVGRGPARFSRTHHEYDNYSLRKLTPGAHLIAVLVQWAPNIRRSESTAPHLMLNIQDVAEN